MLFVDMLRITVLLAAGSATLLATVSVASANSADDTTTLIVAAVWWVAATIAGLIAGRPERAADAIRPMLAGAKMSTTLPSENPSRVAISRLWPIAAYTLLAGGLGFVFPGVAAIGTGFAIFVALAWRRREAAVAAVEDRDGVRFHAEPGSAFEPLRLIRTPGLRRDRDPPGHPPPPPTAPA